MRRRMTLLAAVAVLTMMLASGCALADLIVSNDPGPAPTPSFTPRPTFTPTTPATIEPVVAPTFTPTPEPEPTATPEEQPTPEPTAVPEPEPTPTPEAARLVINNPTLNVRSGPGTNFGVIGQARNGERYDVTGRNQAGSWYEINFNGRTGWVASQFVRIEGDPGAIQVAANIPAPPVQPTRPPVPTPVPQPTAPPPPPTPSFPFSLLSGVERCDPNPGTTYFNGYVRRRDNSLMNGVCVHIAYFGPRNTKCSGCDGVGDGVWGFSPFGGPAPAGTTVEIYVVECPAGGMPAGGQTQDSGFGDLTPKSEKWSRTINASEQCVGITFVSNQ
jgi:hypothetical protein